MKEITLALVFFLLAVVAYCLIGVIGWVATRVKCWLYGRRIQKDWDKLYEEYEQWTNDILGWSVDDDDVLGLQGRDR